MVVLRAKALITGACTALLAACSSAPKVVPIEGIVFPVVLITGQMPTHGVPHRADIESNARYLSLMRVERYSTLAGPPIVIDSNARIYDMNEIKGEHGHLRKAHGRPRSQSCNCSCGYPSLRQLLRCRCGFAGPGSSDLLAGDQKAMRTSPPNMRGRPGTLVLRPSVAPIELPPE